MAKKQPTISKTQFNEDEITALKELVGYVLQYDAIRPPYSGGIESVLIKLQLLNSESPEMKNPAAFQRPPVKMQ